MSDKKEVQETIEKLVDEALEENTQENVEKSMPTSKEENGGDDKIKSGTPMTEMKGDPLAQEEPKEKTGSKHSKAVKKSEETADLAKAEDCEKEAKEEVKSHEKKMHSKKIKKSIEELSELLDEEEVELLKAWREEQAETEEQEMKSEDIAKAVSDATNVQVEELKKSMQAQNDLIKSLSEQINKLSSQPAHDKRSIETLEPLAKSIESEPSLNKSQVLEVMLDLQMQGKGVTSHHVAEFEATGNISNSSIKQLVMSEAGKK
jgi:hypothetical protein